ncbi:MAG: heme biosynthesis protein HemY [Hahellaceae bacterium]|nr:heme biosynthesis protein HemY [Hahellaceae bacterium]MCP5168333.1 heme biosynthesis protein HemY [Hahellaceae bacterium]
MRNTLILILLALTAAAGLSLFLGQDSGYLRLAWGNYILETSLWVAIALFFLLNGAVLVILKSFNLVSQSSYRLGDWHSQRRKLRARRRTTLGLLAYAEGNWQRAQKQLSAAAPDADTPLINYLAAAQAAHELGLQKESETLLRKAYDSTPGADVAVGLTQAQLSLANNDYEQGLATLLRLRKQLPDHPFILKLLKNVYLKLEDWQQLGLLIPDLRRAGIIETAELDALERQTWLNLLTHAADEIRRQHGSSRNIELLNRLWDRLPSTMRKDETVIHAYASHLAALGAADQAETLIRKVVRHHWSDMLIDLYGRIDSEHKEEQLISAENWLKERPNNATLLLALGRLSLRNELWGKAKEYFETSLRLKQNRETLAELCRLSAHLGEHQNSVDYLLQGLLKDASLPDLPMPTSK